MSGLRKMCVVALFACLLVGCGGSTDAASDAASATGEETQTEAVEQDAETTEAGTTDGVDTNDPMNQPGKTFDIPFADAAKLEALGLREIAFTEDRSYAPVEGNDTVNIWVCHDIPAGEYTSEYDEFGACDFIDREKGFFGNYSYTTIVPVGEDEVSLSYHFNYDSSYTEGAECDDTGFDDVKSFLDVTDNCEYQVMDEGGDPCVLSSQVDPMRDDESVYLRSFRIFRITDDTTVVVEISTDHTLVGSEEYAPVVEKFEALSDAFGMASPYTQAS